MSYYSAGTAIRRVKGVPEGDVSPIRHSFRAEFDVMVTMRDGTQLAMDLLVPETAGPFPVILSRTPYDKSVSRKSPSTEDFVRRGYVVVLQDCRGRANSDGTFDPYRQEHNDGFDTVEWIAQQEWCDGNVGMIGGSYAAQTQWFAASQAPKALKAIVPTASPPGNVFLNEPFYGGTMILAMVEWMVTMKRRCVESTSLNTLMTEHQDYFEALPLSRVGEMSGTHCDWWENQWLQHPTLDGFWHSCGYEQFWDNITVPALNITGWWDMNFIGALRNYVGMREQGAGINAREGQRLIIGPWEHWVNHSRALSGQDFGADAITNLNGYTLRFFDRWLRGKVDNGIDNDPGVHVFVTGANQWWEADTWPLPGTKQTKLYLHSDGGANSHRGDGRLSFDKPNLEPSDHFESDPADPVRSPWSLHEGPVDDRAVSCRHDVLCYTSGVLNESLDVVGEVSAVLYAASAARDCDWHIRLIDVYPDGTARFLCHGALRARFREGFDRNAFLVPNEVTRFDINMTATGIRFLVGHRIRVEVASSWFPRFDRNTQTGAVNWMKDTCPPVLAKQTIRHDKDYPSNVSLPVISISPT